MLYVIVCEQQRFRQGCALVQARLREFAARLCKKINMPIQLHVCWLITIYRENFLQLDVFFRELSYEHIQQQVAYSIFALLCEYINKNLCFSYYDKSSLRHFC